MFFWVFHGANATEAGLHVGYDWSRRPDLLLVTRNWRQLLGILGLQSSSSRQMIALSALEASGSIKGGADDEVRREPVDFGFASLPCQVFRGLAFHEPLV